MASCRLRAMESSSTDWELYFIKYKKRSVCFFIHKSTSIVDNLKVTNINSPLAITNIISYSSSCKIAPNPFIVPFTAFVVSYRHSHETTDLVQSKKKYFFATFLFRYFYIMTPKWLYNMMIKRSISLSKMYRYLYV